MKQQFLEDKAGTIRVTAYENNRPIVPSSGNVTLLKPDGSSLQASTAVTVNATTGEMTYALTSTHTADRGLNFRADYDYVVGGSTKYASQLFDVVKSKLFIPIIDDDLYDELDSLRRVADQQTGTATAGAADALTDTARRKEVDDYWTGGTIKIISGTGVDQERAVSDFVQSTGVVSVSPDFVTTPDTTSVYIIIKSFTKKIAQAFEVLETMLYNKGKRHQLILESSQIRVPLIYLTIHSTALDLSDEIDDRWDMIQKIYKEKFETFFQNMKLEYDEDDSGTISGDEGQDSPTAFKFERA